MASPCAHVFSRHQMLYKSKTPPWKETYRNQCRERLRKGRQALFDSFRSTGEACHSEQQLRYSVTEVVREELDKFHSASAESSTAFLSRGEEGAAAGVPWDEAQVNEQLMEETLAALLEEELNVWKQYESMLALQNQEIDAAVHTWSSEIVVCPVCLRNDLNKKEGRIICACGLTIPTALSLTEFRLCVERAIESHSTRCPSSLTFSLIEACEPALVCLCNCCDFMSSVL
ncbi:RPA-interacting protein A [Dermacentor silvarum]|nr:RPA-interacting protein A [Dermacentor silvarum]